MDGKNMEAHPVVTQNSPASDKISLFRSLFRGRTDVYPRRFESRKTGRTGYGPACANEWVRGLCDKRKVKCADCPNRRLLPVTDEVIRRHLTGLDGDGREFVAGIYPLLLDETCYFLAADFDKENWSEDIREMFLTCRNIGLPAAVERSRSGNGAHLWLFFEEAIPAVLARKLGAHLLTETMDRRPDIGLDSYDRLFPNQDTLPKGGFGNLIALPLQRRAREAGNSVFLDVRLEPFADQWVFLSSIRKITKTQVEAIVREAEAKGCVTGVRFVLDEEGDEEPWMLPPSRVRRDPPMTGPLPSALDLVLGNEIYISKAELAPALRNRLLRLAAFQNPEFYRAQAMRLPTFDKPRIIACAEDHGDHIGLPRGCLDEVKALLASLDIGCRITEQRYSGVPLDVIFQGVLRPEQVSAAKALELADTGVLAATTAFGKTVIAAWLIAQRKVNTLVLVHRHQLQEQWIERLSAFLGLPAKSIGRIGGGRKKPTGRLDVALIQSLVRKGVVSDIVGDYGHLVVDECHHLPATSFEQVARRAKAKYVLGLTATVTRKDGHHPIISMQCGPVRYRVSAKQQATERPFTHSVLVRPTSFRNVDAEAKDMRIQFHDLYDAMIMDHKRNSMICDDIEVVLREGRKPMVLTERREHLELLGDLLSPRVQHLVVLQGGMGQRHLHEALARLAAIPEDEDRVLLATGRYLGEGFDDARLDTLFLTLPISWRGTIAQYVGRLHRRHDLKREVRVYDYADLNIPMLAKMFDRRCRGYEAAGYTILLPANAVPGWPPEVPLPVDTEWKRDYAASVQRLIRDGVDAPLGNLFVHAARTTMSGSQGVEQARSATEAFLFRRLESLVETRGRFRLNVGLPIPFCESDSMEIDLFCAEARLAVEMDGPQHLNDLDTYRRDRLKDALLQEHGYFVLRFLAEDIGKHLDRVLDMILRVLAHQGAHEKGRIQPGDE
jgi:superfamily II DNA or RNA helicase/very-short-patch-repair endonuclease